MPQDIEEAVRWYTAAAKQGNPQAQNNLGVCYLKGTGVNQNLKEAAKWITLSAQQGAPEAQHTLGVFYEKGIGVETDLSKAKEWWKKRRTRALSFPFRN